jgi:hypothetical protein
MDVPARHEFERFGISVSSFEADLMKRVGVTTRSRADR